MEIRLRPAFHDLLDDDGGYPSHMEIRVLEQRQLLQPDAARLGVDAQACVEGALSMNVYF